MIYIRTVSDLRNEYPEVIKCLDEESVLEARFGVMDIEKSLEEAEEEANKSNAKYYSHEEMKKMARGIIDGE